MKTYSMGCEVTDVTREAKISFASYLTTIAPTSRGKF